MPFPVSATGITSFPNFRNLRSPISLVYGLPSLRRRNVPDYSFVAERKRYMLKRFGFLRIPWPGRPGGSGTYR